MALLIHDTLATTEFVEPIRREWIVPERDVALETDLTATHIPADGFALVPSPECTLLVGTHAIVPEIAVVAVETGAIAMRSPVRADDIETAKVLLYDVSGTAELLARALLWPFFGIAASGWSSEPELDVVLTIMEGAPALQEPEAGHSEDLVRSWFVMTGLPVVTHVLLAPLGASSDEVEQIVALLTRSQQAAHERRRDLRRLMVEDLGIERDRLVGFLGQQRYRLESADREALVALIVKGAGGSRYLPLTRLPFREREEEGDAASGGLGLS